jgi:regulator of nucleoside diphosphate kinase
MLTITEPQIKMTKPDADKLLDLAKANLRGSPELTSFLIGEITRALLIEPEGSRNVVVMNSLVEFHYDLTDQVRQVQLVYPHQADITKAKISVMTAIGIALIGLSEGQHIEWRTLRGSKRGLTVLKVRNPE